jgi:hypothetical protein
MTKTENKSKCRLGFACASIMQNSQIRADRCPNRATCREIVNFEFDERASFLMVRRLDGSLVEEYIELSRHEAAVMMLMQRGCPQTLDDFGLLESIDTIIELLGDLRSQIESYQGQYIAPDGCEMHTYNVKHNDVELQPNNQGELVPHPIKVVYTYYKLAAKRPIFAPSIEPNNVKVIHLSRTDDPRSLESRRGIERRNRLSMLRSQLRHLETEIVDRLVSSSPSGRG